jgi:hypothetical protein
MTQAALKRLPAAQIKESDLEQDEQEEPVMLQPKSMWYLIMKL